jgi:hypothetical protein
LLLAIQEKADVIAHRIVRSLLQFCRANSLPNNAE